MKEFARASSKDVSANLNEGALVVAFGEEDYQIEILPVSSIWRIKGKSHDSSIIYLNDAVGGKNDYSLSEKRANITVPFHIRDLAKYYFMAKSGQIVDLQEHQRSNKKTSNTP